MDNPTSNRTIPIKRGPKVKSLDPLVADQLISKVIVFLRMLMTETLAIRIVSAILLSVGIPDTRVFELTGLSERGIRDLRKKLREDLISEDLFVVGGGGREGKLQNVEEIIAETIENNDFHTQQEIADMIYKEHKIKVHRSTVSRFLKKNISGH